ncbi:RbsD/FucU domain-containing protein [Oceanobacillus senegalensis]|uniref:RbsD/FucU domain-containing protein n=1 Tax=Oceanobacillus senegalensis TaxID=1936063 RepID=UPI000A305F5D|nr:RbsD/FucU domain-containing protein [Oceanobacillus senegalensis]
MYERSGIAVIYVTVLRSVEVIGRFLKLVTCTFSGYNKTISSSDCRALTYIFRQKEKALETFIETGNGSLNTRLMKAHSGIPVEYISHEELKTKLKNMKAIIRTGEATPFANVILQQALYFKGIEVSVIG